MIDAIRRLGGFRNPVTGHEDVGSRASLCFWVPIAIAVTSITWVATRVKRWIEECDWPWKIFRWIVGFVLVLVWVAVVVVTTIVIWGPSAAS